jgi:hypothetical protein
MVDEQRVRLIRGSKRSEAVPKRPPKVRHKPVKIAPRNQQRASRTISRFGSLFQRSPRCSEGGSFFSQN